MSGLTDFHSHLLPGIDDGSRDLSESLAMLALEAEQGVRRVVATPHFYPRQDYPDQFLHRRSRAEAWLRQELKDRPELPEVLVGAEVAFFRGMSESEYLPLLTIRDTPCILVELEPGPWPQEVFRELEAIWRRRELLPVIAHIDRYLPPLGARRLMHRLEELPVLIQANGSFFRGSRAGLAMELLRRDQIHLLGSDCHNLTTRRPDLGPAAASIEKKLGPAPLETIREHQKRTLGY